MSRLDDVEQRCAEAAPGPWRHQHNPNGDAIYGPYYSTGDPTTPGEDKLIHLGHAFEYRDCYPGTPAFIAHARTDLPDLAATFRTVAEALLRYERRGYPVEVEALALCDRWLKDQEGD